MNLKTLNQGLATAATMGVVAIQSASAQEIPEIGGAFQDNGDLVTTTRNLVTQFLDIALILVGVVIFAVVGWALVGKFYECTRGRAEWGESFVTIGGGVAVLIVAGVILSLGADVLTGAAPPADGG